MVKRDPITVLMPAQTPGWRLCRGHLGQPAPLNRQKIQTPNSPSNGALTTFPEELCNHPCEFPELNIFSLSCHPHLANSLIPIQQSRFRSKSTSPMKSSLTFQGKPSSEQLLGRKVHKTHPFPPGNCHSLLPAPMTPI